MKNVLVAMILAGTLFATKVQAEDFLAPCDDFLKEYDDQVDALVHDQMPGTVELWATVIPSFTPEWGVGVSSNEDQHLLTFVVFDDSLWHGSWVSDGLGVMRQDLSIGSIKPIAKTSRISAKLYDALRLEWDRSIGNTKASDISGLDGVTYYFKLSDRCASAWSPQQGTRNSSLAALVEELRKLAAKEHRQVSPRGESRVLTKLRKLSSH